MSARRRRYVIVGLRFWFFLASRVAVSVGVGLGVGVGLRLIFEMGTGVGPGSCGGVGDWLIDRLTD